jgi:hypothetical protein
MENNNLKKVREERMEIQEELQEVLRREENPCHPESGASEGTGSS